MTDASDTPAPARIRVRYDRDIEETEATRLGPAPAGGERHRVHHPSFAVPVAARGDVLRLEHVEGDLYRFVEVLERSGWVTERFVIPSASLGTPYHDYFRRSLEAAGCIVEREVPGPQMCTVVVSVPPRPRTGAGRGRTPAGEGSARDDATGRGGHPRHPRSRRRSARWRALGRRVRSGARVLGSVAAEVAQFAAPFVLAAWMVAELSTASPAGRPRAAAIAMAGSLLPALLHREGRDLWPFWVIGIGTAMGALELVSGTAPPYAMAVLIGLLHALWLGGVGVYLGIFTGFAGSSREAGRALLRGALPALLSALSGLALALSALIAARAAR